MTTLSATRTRQFISSPTRPNEKHPVLASTKIYSGSGVCKLDAAGYARPIAASLTNPSFLGFAEEPIDNSAGADGALEVNIKPEGVLLLDTITGAVGRVDVDKPVYMSDDGTGFTLTALNNVLIGAITNYIDGKFRVFFQAKAYRSQ